MVTLIQTVFSGPCVVGGGVNTLCFEDPADEAAAEVQAGWVGDFWEDLMPYLDEDLAYAVEPGSRRLAAADGSLQEVFAFPSSSIDVGAVSGNAVPRAAQALIRLGTANIVNGRSIKGRIFVPGVAGIHMTDAGGLSSTVRTAFTTAAETLITASGGTLAVWHRPQNGSGGSSHLVTTASVWEEFAVLRSRRD